MLYNIVAAFEVLSFKCRDVLRGLFAGDDSLAGANFCARTALDAGIGIDVVDFAFRDSVNGTNGLASATSHARVSNNVSHDRLILVWVDNLYEK